MRPLLLLFVAMPILEMWLLITVGSEIGALPTIGLVLFTAVLGLAMLRRQGLSTVMRARQKAEVGELPAREMVEGIFLAVGGVLLLTPGFITDVLGFACLIPGLRQLVLLRLLRHVTIVGNGHASSGARANHRFKDHNVIEGDYSRDESHSGKDDKRHPD